MAAEPSLQLGDFLGLHLAGLPRHAFQFRVTAVLLKDIAHGDGAPMMLDHLKSVSSVRVAVVGPHHRLLHALHRDLIILASSTSVIG